MRFTEEHHAFRKLVRNVVESMVPTCVATRLKDRYGS